MCGRKGCKETENLMVHSRRLRKDGTFYERKYCRKCQRERHVSKRDRIFNRLREKYA